MLRLNTEVLISFVNVLGTYFSGMGSIHTDLIWSHFSTPFSIGTAAWNIINNFWLEQRCLKIFYKFFIATAEKKVAWSFNFQLPQYKRGIIVTDAVAVADFFLLDSIRYRGDVMATLMSNWCNHKIMMLGWYSKLTSSCVSFTIHQQFHGDIVTISECPLGLY